METADEQKRVQFQIRLQRVATILSDRCFAGSGKGLEVHGNLGYNNKECNQSCMNSESKEAAEYGFSHG